MTESIRRPLGGPKGAGKPKMKRLYIYGGAAVLVVGAVLWERKRSNTGANATDTTGTDTTGTDLSAGDGYTSNPGYGAGSVGGPVGVTPGTNDTGTGGTDTTGTGDTGFGATGLPFQAPTNNPEWSYNAITALETEGGYDGITASTAIGKFLAGASLTQDEYNIVTAALALTGNPPTAVQPPHLMPAHPQAKPATHSKRPTTPHEKHHISVPEHPEAHRPKAKPKKRILPVRKRRPVTHK